jgi:sodium/bile acid cotransporter 7
MIQRVLDGFSHLIRKNLLLMGILGAIWMSMHHPVPSAFLDRFDVNTPLVATIFLIQGLRMSFDGCSNLRSYAVMIGAAALVSVVGYPLLAHLLSAICGLVAFFRSGCVRRASRPAAMAPAMAMAASAGGDPLTAIILLVSLNLIGIVSIPANLSLWLGGVARVGASMVLKKLLLFLFLPAIAGQILRRLFPALPGKTETLSRYVPMVCITILVYTSCSRESALFHSLRLSDLAHIVAPCLLLHVIMLGVAHLTARRALRLGRTPARSFLFITSDKPMSLSVALWSMAYAQHHPLAIFPILVFYVGQVVFDSMVVSGMIRRDFSEQT